MSIFFGGQFHKKRIHKLIYKIKTWFITGLQELIDLFEQMRLSTPVYCIKQEGGGIVMVGPLV